MQNLSENTVMTRPGQQRESATEDEHVPNGVLDWEIASRFHKNLHYRCPRKHIGATSFKQILLTTYYTFLLSLSPKKI